MEKPPRENFGFIYGTGCGCDVYWPSYGQGAESLLQNLWNSFSVLTQLRVGYFPPPTSPTLFLPTLSPADDCIYSDFSPLTTLYMYINSLCTPFVFLLCSFWVFIYYVDSQLITTVRGGRGGEINFLFASTISGGWKSFPHRAALKASGNVYPPSSVLYSARISFAFGNNDGKGGGGSEPGLSCQIFGFVTFWSPCITAFVNKSV